MNTIGRLWTFQLRLLRSLLLVALRRTDGVGPGDVALPYARAATPTGVLFVGLTVVELVLAELLVPWASVRHVLLVLGAWGLLVVAGLLAMEWTHPHVVRADGVLLRAGGLVTVHVPRDAVVAVERRARYEHATWALDGDHLYLPVAGGTAVDLVLGRPVPVRVGRQDAAVTRISLAADDVPAALQVLRSASSSGGCYPSPR